MGGTQASAAPDHAVSEADRRTLTELLARHVPHPVEAAVTDLLAAGWRPPAPTLTTEAELAGVPAEGGGHRPGRRAVDPRRRGPVVPGRAGRRRSRRAGGVGAAGPAHRRRRPAGTGQPHP